MFHKPRVRREGSLKRLAGNSGFQRVLRIGEIDLRYGTYPSWPIPLPRNVKGPNNE